MVVREKEGMGTKDKLIRSAFNLFVEKGYTGACTREIEREAGVNEITLFRHFGTKESLFECLLQEYPFLP
jgi:AcrR family transcriptional regulator